MDLNLSCDTNGTDSHNARTRGYHAYYSNDLDYHSLNDYKVVAWWLWHQYCFGCQGVSIALNTKGLALL